MPPVRKVRSREYGEVIDPATGDLECDSYVGRQIAHAVLDGSKFHGFNA